MGMTGNGEGTIFDWTVGTGSHDSSTSMCVWQDYGLTEKEINIFDFLPTSELNSDIKLEELSGCSNIPLVEESLDVVKSEEDEPCAAAVAIAANIPKPSKMKVLKWRTFINAAYYHPNILAHTDVSCIKELLQLLGSNVRFENNNVMVDLGQTIQDYKPAPYLRPSLPSTQKPLIFSFAHVKDFKIDIDLKVCIVKKYGLDDSMKKAIQDLSSFIVTYPEALYLEVYGFILDFLLRYRVNSDIVIDAVMRTQARRRKCQQPASVLLLKMANKLGKGKKEFLQRKLMETPNHKYHPVVPIIEEPPPVRQLRSRRSAVVDVGRTPEAVSRTSCPQIPKGQTSRMFEPDRPSSCAETLVYAVKRKLFFDDDEKRTVSTVISNVPSKPNIPAKVVVGGGKKRFFGRRDSNTIEKPFICSICPSRGFAYKGNLVLHMKRKHSLLNSVEQKTRQENLVPAFSCPVCMQGYASKYKCKAHVYRLHPESVDQAPICNLQLTTRKTLVPAKKRVKRLRQRRRGSIGTFSKGSRRLHPLLDKSQNASQTPNSDQSKYFRASKMSQCYSRAKSVAFHQSQASKHHHHQIQSRSRVHVFQEASFRPVRSLRTRQRSVTYLN